MQIWLFIFALIWITGIVLLVIGSLISLLRLKKQLVGSIRLRDNIYLADHISSPFVMGLLHPRIYLPSTLCELERCYIIRHEQTHIHRHDHIFKIIAFGILCVHWFNPLVWIAFILYTKDMEMSCDEKVIKEFGADIRSDYSASLLSLASGRRMIAGTPLAFGEGNTHSRIKNVMNYKAPAFWITGLALATVLFVSIGLLMNSYTNITPQNTLRTATLSETQESELITEYQLDINSYIFQTDFNVPDTIKNCTFYVEAYQHGTPLETNAEYTYTLKKKQNSVVTSLSLSSDDSDTWRDINWHLFFTEKMQGSAISHSSPLPSDLVPLGMATSRVSNIQDDRTATEITPDVPIILAGMAFQSEDRTLRAPDCEYLMANPSAIAEYEYIYLVKCVFSK